MVGPEWIRGLDLAWPLESLDQHAYQPPASRVQWIGVIHSGRRTRLTELSSKGVGVRVLAEMAGHASIQTTQRYIDVNDEQMRKAAELI